MESTRFAKFRSYLWPIVLYRTQGNLNHGLELTLYRGKLLLDADRVNYSFGTLHKVMKGALNRVHSSGGDFSRVLILGYGGGSAAKIIHEDYSNDAEIVGVDADEKVIELASKHFYTRGVKLVHSDAFDYVNQARKNGWKYSLLIVDLFVNELSPNYSLAQLESFKSILSPNGKMIINTMLDDQEFRDLELKLQELNIKYESWIKVEGNRVIIA